MVFSGQGKEFKKDTKKGFVLDCRNPASLGVFLKKRGLVVLKKISKGYSSTVFLVQNRAGKKFALKVEKQKSPRKNLVQKEASFLRLANTKKIGPMLFGFDEKAGTVLMEFVSGPTFDKWLFEKNPSKKVLQNFAEKLLVQAKKLDELGLDHGQLAGRGRNILVRRGLPVIIDFEKASTQRKCGNANQVRGFLFENPHSAIAKRVRKKTGKIWCNPCIGLRRILRPAKSRALILSSR